MKYEYRRQETCLCPSTDSNAFLWAAANCSICLLVSRQILLFRLGANQESSTCWLWTHMCQPGLCSQYRYNIHVHKYFFQKPKPLYVYHVSEAVIASMERQTSVGSEHLQYLQENFFSAMFRTKFLQQLWILIDTSTLRFCTLSPIFVYRRYTLTILH
jgi:hypothetical protein